jgi:hypothetical protein
MIPSDLSKDVLNRNHMVVRKKDGISKKMKILTYVQLRSSS